MYMHNVYVHPIVTLGILQTPSLGKTVLHHVAR